MVHPAEIPEASWTTKMMKNLGVHPWKLTCPQKRDYFSREYIFQPLIFRGHVSFQGCTLKNPSEKTRVWYQEATKNVFLVKCRPGWWFQPPWKIVVKLDHFPQVGVKTKNIWNHHLETVHTKCLFLYSTMKKHGSTNCWKVPRLFTAQIRGVETWKVWKVVWLPSSCNIMSFSKASEHS